MFSRYTTVFTDYLFFIRLLSLEVNEILILTGTPKYVGHIDMALRTYGDKPISFQVEENGEYYCIGSEVSMLIYRMAVRCFNIKERRSLFCLCNGYRTSRQFVWLCRGIITTLYQMLSSYLIYTFILRLHKQSNLDHYDIFAVPWYDLSKSYLKNRYQKVLRVSKDSFYSIFSEWGNVKHGVPKGSILGPLLFLFYVNDFPKIIKISSKPPRFAHDTSLIITRPSPVDFKMITPLDLFN